MHGDVELERPGSHAAPPQSHRTLRTVLFTDIVASIERAAATGDEQCKALAVAIPAAHTP